MAQSVRTRPHGTIEYVANNTESLTLKRGFVMRELYLKLSGQVTLTSGNNIEANILRGDEWSIVKRVRLIANGTDVLFDMDGNALWWHNLHWYGERPGVSPAIAKATTNPIFGPDPSLTAARQGSHLIIPLWMVGSRRPMDTALDTRIMSDLVLEIDWGSHLNIAASATGFTVAPEIKVTAAESFGVPDDAQFSSWRRFKIEKDVTSTSSTFEIDLPVNRIYRGLMLNTTDAGVDVSDVLNEIRVRSGTNVFHTFDSETLQDISRLRNGVLRHFDPATEAYDPMRRGSANDMQGWYWIDWILDGMLSEAIDTVGFVEFTIECDVTIGAGATKLIAYPSSIIPVRG